MTQYDVVVIGAGSAGFAAGRSAAAAGAKVAIVEGAKEVGGLCILRGCMPTKSLLESSHRWREIQRAPEFGLKAKPLTPDLKAIMARKDRLIADFAGYRRKQLSKGPFTFLRGAATFRSHQSIQVGTGSKAQLIRSKTFVIATGSEIQPPSVAGLEETGFLTSDSALELQKLPKSLIVLGGGAVAVEFAQFFHDLGVKTTIVQRNPKLVKEFDPKVGQALRASFEDDGMTVHTGTTLIRVDHKGKSKTVTFLQGKQTHTVAAEEIFYALGRRPAISTLGLSLAGVRVENEAIATVSTQATSQGHIFAAGDVTGQYEVVHIGIQQGENAGWNAAQIAKEKNVTLRKMDYRLKTSVVFTQPEIASVGMNELEAKASGQAYVTASYPFNDHGKSMIMGAKFGFVKLLANRQFGEIIGGQIIGPHASDLIHELIAVMSFHGTAKEVAAMPHYHPTLAEIITYPAQEIADLVASIQTP